jgi:heat shock protein HslJ
MGRLLAATAWLLFTGVLLALAGCSRSELLVDDPLLASRWLVVSFTDRDGALPIPTDFVPYLEIDKDGFSFTSTCNTLPFAAQFADGQIELGIMVIRGVGCSEAISQAANDLEKAVLEAMPGWTTYTLQGNELIIPFDGGEIRFSRLIPPNPAGLRAFPLQRATDAEPTYDEGKWLQRGPILLEDGCLRVGVSDSMFTSYLIVWPPQYAVAFDDEAAWATWPDMQTVQIGDEVVLSGGRLLEIEPLLDAEVLRLGSIPNTCSGPYWVMEDVEVLE